MCIYMNWVCESTRGCACGRTHVWGLYDPSNVSGSSDPESLSTDIECPTLAFLPTRPASAIACDSFLLFSKPSGGPPGSDVAPRGGSSEPTRSATSSSKSSISPLNLKREKGEGGILFQRRGAGGQCMPTNLHPYINTCIHTCISNQPEKGMRTKIAKSQKQWEKVKKATEFLLKSGEGEWFLRALVFVGELFELLPLHFGERHSLEELLLLLRTGQQPLPLALHLAALLPAHRLADLTTRPVPMGTQR